MTIKERKEYNKRYYLQNKEKRKEYLLRNKDKIAKGGKQYRLQNKEKIKQYQLQNKEKSKRYCLRNKEKIKKRVNKYRINRKKIDINFKLSCGLRNRLNRAIKNNYKLGSAIKDLGCPIEYLKRYLESQFIKGMNWDNYGKWQIDHQIPLSIVDLIDRENLLQVCHYTNLQPMWADKNKQKGNLINI